MIRPATPEDMPQLLKMGRKFHDAAAPPFEMDPEALEAAFLGMMDKGCLLVSGGGMIGGILGPAWARPDWVYAVELLWWAEDGQGLPLLRAFEDWARNAGANEVRMTSLTHLDRAHRVLTRSGYAQSEINYGKVL